MNQNFIENALAGVMPAVLATGLCVSLFTAQEPVPTQEANGAIAFDYVDVAGLVGLTCIAASQSPSSITATETRALEEITASELHEVIIPQYLPQLDNGWRGEAPDAKGAWICQISWNGVFNSYEIQGVGYDSQSQGTWVKVKLASI
jgi:hypothetical protein